MAAIEYQIKRVQLFHRETLVLREEYWRVESSETNSYFDSTLSDIISRDDYQKILSELKSEIIIRIQFGEYDYIVSQDRDVVEVMTWWSISENRHRNLFDRGLFVDTFSELVELRVTNPTLGTFIRDVDNEETYQEQVSGKIEYYIAMLEENSVDSFKVTSSKYCFQYMHAGDELLCDALEPILYFEEYSGNLRAFLLDTSNKNRVFTHKELELSLADTELSIIKNRPIPYDYDIEFYPIHEVVEIIDHLRFMAAKHPHLTVTFGPV